MRPETFAEELERAWEERRPIEPLSDRGLKGIEAAYRVQEAWNALRLGKGDRVVGRKIGLTSKAVQEQLGVDQPDFGNLWESRFFGVGERVEVEARLFLQPRVEGELAFLIGRRLEGPGVTPQEVLAATEAVAFAIEIVDSRIRDWRIRIEDTIADNASYGGSWWGLGRRPFWRRTSPPWAWCFTRTGNPWPRGRGRPASATRRGPWPGSPTPSPPSGWPWSPGTS